MTTPIITHVEQTVCNNPDHCHHSPIQNMVEMQINDHVVQVTQDGDLFNVRIDHDDLLTQFDLTGDEAGEYVSIHTEE